MQRILQILKSAGIAKLFALVEEMLFIQQSNSLYTDKKLKSIDEKKEGKKELSTPVLAGLI